MEINLGLSATESVAGDVQYTVGLAVTSHDLPDPLDPTTPPLSLDIQLPVVAMNRADSDVLVEVDWSLEYHNYTILDLLSSTFANFNISLTLLAFLFPWRMIFRRRKFVLDIEDEEEQLDIEAFVDEKRLALTRNRQMEPMNSMA